MPTLEQAVSQLTLGLAIALLLRLYATRLHRLYPYLSIYLLAYAAILFVLTRIPLHSNAYGYGYIAGDITQTCLAVGVVLEIFRVALADRAALASFGGKTVGYIMGAAAVVAAAGLMLDAEVRAGQSRIIHRFFTVERTMDFTVMMFLLLISGIMLWFPIRVKRNLIFYLTGFVVFYFVHSFGLLATNLLPPEFLRSISTGLMFVNLACLLAWLFGLRRDGEKVTTVAGHRWDPAAAERLTGQLDQINAALERFGRRQT